MRTHKCIYIYAPTLGVKADFETLLQKFTQTSTVRYEKFAEIFRDMKLSKFCAGRNTHRECREFVEECFKIAMPFWLPPSSFQVRVGALYLIYGLYYCQLVNPKVKIRITNDQWKKLLEFQDQAREQQHLDVDYVFQKMRIDSAFMFVAKNEEIFPQMKDPSGSNLPDVVHDDNNHIDEVFTSQVLNQLSVVHDQYHKMKVAIDGPESTEPDSSLDIVHRDLIHSIYKTIRMHREKQAGPHAQGRKDVDESLAPAEGGEELAANYNSLKLNLKKKAFGHVPGKAASGEGGTESRDQLKPGRAGDTNSATMMSPPAKPVVFKRGRTKLANIYSKEDMEVNLPESFNSTALLSMPPLAIIKPVLPISAEDKTPGSKADGTETESETSEIDQHDTSVESSSSKYLGPKSKAGKKKGKKKDVKMGVKDGNKEKMKGQKKKRKSESNIDHADASVGSGKGKKKKLADIMESLSGGDSSLLESLKKEKGKKIKSKKKKPVDDTVGLDDDLGQQKTQGKIRKSKAEALKEPVDKDKEVTNSVKEEKKSVKRKGKIDTATFEKDSGVSSAKKIKSAKSITDSDKTTKDNKLPMKYTEINTSDSQQAKGKKQKSANPVTYTEILCTPSANPVTYTEILCTPSANPVTYTEILCTPTTNTDTAKSGKGKKQKPVDKVTYTEIVSKPTIKSAETLIEIDNTNKEMKSKEGMGTGMVGKGKKKKAANPIKMEDVAVGEVGEHMPAGKSAQEQLQDKINQRKKKARKERKPAKLKH